MSDNGTINIEEYRKSIQQATARKAQLNRMQEQLNAMVKERDEAVARAEKLAAEKDALVAEADEELTKLEAERDDWKAKYDKAPSEHLEELNALRREKSETAHESAFAKVAGKLGVDERYIKDLRKIAGYEAADGPPDESAIEELLAGTVKDRPWLVKEAPATGPGTPAIGRGEAAVAAGGAAQAPPKGVGASRGGPPQGDQAGFFRVTRDQLRDPVFTRENQARIAEASREGKFQIAE